MANNINPPVVNKTNFLAALMLLLGAISDPQFTAILPTEYAPKILYFSGLILMVIRVFFTGKKSEDSPVTP